MTQTTLPEIVAAARVLRRAWRASLESDAASDAARLRLGLACSFASAAHHRSRLPEEAAVASMSAMLDTLCDPADPNLDWLRGTPGTGVARNEAPA